MKLVKVFLFVTLLSSSFVKAEQSEVFGAYTVHYIAVNSTFLDPDIANEYNILRGDRRAFLNISILKNSDGSAVPATISGSKRNLLGQIQQLDFVKITEGDAIYYIGQFDFSNAEDVRFEVEVQPESKGRSYSLQWSGKFYNN